MRRNGGRHADRNAARSVDEQVRKLARQNGRLHPFFIVGRNIVDRVKLQDPPASTPRPATSELRYIASRLAAILPPSQNSPACRSRYAACSILRHPNQRWIDDAFAVRMVIAAGVARDLRTFDTGRAWTQDSSHSSPPGFAAGTASNHRGHLAALAKR